MIKKCYIHSAASIAPDGTISATGSLLAVEPEYKDIIQNPNLRRRMSRIIRMGVACGLKCLSENQTESVDAIITATGLGCLADTEKFLNNLIEQEEQLLNPTAFIQSTFNTIGSQIALMIGCQAYNNTFVHRGLSFESALIDSMMRINEGDRRLLVGAIDELTPTSHNLLNRLGLLNGITAGEGTQFFLLGDDAGDNCYAELCGVDIFSGQLDPSSLENRVRRFLSEHAVEAADIQVLMTGKNGNTEQDEDYEFLCKGLFSSSRQETFKDTCGEYFTASSYALWKAANDLRVWKDGHKQYTLLYNQTNNVNHALILLASC